MAGTRLRVVQHWEHREGFRGTMRAREGRLPFPLAIVESPIYDEREYAQLWAFRMLVENAERMGPFAIATVAPYSGPVSVIEIV
jgi:hypothetical protein